MSSEENDLLILTNILTSLFSDFTYDAQITQNKRGEWFLRLNGILELQEREVEALKRRGITPEWLRERKERTRREGAGDGMMWTKGIDGPG